MVQPSAAFRLARRSPPATPTTCRRTDCRQALAAYKVPRLFRFVEENELPLTVTGKLQKNRLATFFPGAVTG